MLRGEIDNESVINILSDKGLDFFFNKADGYYRSVCIDFYQNMSVGGLDGDEI